jgi:hypothetical protein
MRQNVIFFSILEWSFAFGQRVSNKILNSKCFNDFFDNRESFQIFVTRFALQILYSNIEMIFFESLDNY